MPPTLALFVWLIFLFGLLRFDPAKELETSAALWVPLAWMFIIGTRLPSQWVGVGQVGTAAQVLEEGNSLDRVVYSLLMLLAISILMARSFKWDAFLVRNSALTALLSFALVSVLWSDFPFIAFKRWYRDLGNYLVILVILSDPRPVEAVRTFLRRLFYLLIPLSILLIKYFPRESIHYSFWTGAAEYVGAATSKNTLGAMCMLSGIFFFWDTVIRWSERKERRTRRILLVNVAFLAMTLWLLDKSSSATSRVCLMVGCLVIWAAKGKMFRRHPGFLKVLLPACFVIYLLLSFGLDLSSRLASAIGRDPTFTGRTNIWHAVLSTHTNPLIGTGYESFWLGPRLNQVWQLAGHVNEAHNGYLEIYLNLGVIGLFLLGVLLVSTYRTIFRNLTPLSSLISLNLALWVIALFYNMTEAAFTASFMCLTFLLGTIEVRRAAPVHHIPTTEPLSKEPKSWWQKDAVAL
jgi:exopolysaccharide production protein ExoQ